VPVLWGVVLAVVAGSAYPLVVLAALAFVLAPLRLVLRDRAAGPGLIPVLGLTSSAQLAYGLLLTLGLVLIP
jgi:hypothetical protein